MIYLQLFVSFFKVGLFAFGGGYAALPLMSILVTAFWGSDAVIGAIDFARTNGLMIALFVLSVVLLRKTKIGAVPAMVLAGVLKLCLALIGIG